MVCTVSRKMVVMLAACVMNALDREIWSLSSYSSRVFYHSRERYLGVHSIAMNRLSAPQNNAIIASMILSSQLEGCLTILNLDCIGGFSYCDHRDFMHTCSNPIVKLGASEAMQSEVSDGAKLSHAGYGKGLVVI